ncbi:phage antirepressor KilAC domain-containing protein [Lactobacillus kefiranofaciens]|uniref:phage antirepressor KilAC domain-containing protein n=1 Tax=Lactobacillus kefiranofaciens TaxID=267818 RepID=UPI0024685C5F|nr:phage antirepressor KilAC domain-containing protein [Lactobacillus kefiranofaciens]MDH5099782.1 phage antirepressor KilAC domain-containing protein [Lactobacillus kefiranofaciens]
MNSLINIQVKNNQQLVSARDLHKGLGLTTRFSKWVGQNFDGFEENQDFTSVTTVTVVANGARKPIQDYLLTIDMAKELCMMSKTERGKKVRKYFIQVEKNWNSPDMIMQRALSISKQRIEALQNENAAMKPKALFADAVATSKSDILIGQLAKILRQNGYETGQNRLFKWLREHHYLCSKGVRYNQPTQKAMELGLFKVKERTVNNPDGSSRITVTTKVTGKGQQYFINRFLSSEPNQLSLEIESI